MAEPVHTLAPLFTFDYIPDALPEFPCGETKCWNRARVTMTLWFTTEHLRFDMPMCKVHVAAVTRAMEGGSVDG